MTSRRARVGLAAVATALATVTPALVGPAVASAHGIVGREDLPIPQWLFAWAAAVVLVASFVGLATLWPKPRLEGPSAAVSLEGRTLLTLPRLPLEILFGAFGVLVFGVSVYAGLAGTQTGQANLTPTLVFVAFWVGVPVLSLLFGDVFAALSPWRAIGRVVGTAVRRVGGEATPEPLPYPVWLGRWPATAGILIFAWVELAYPNRDDPSQLAVMMLAYAAVQLLGMSLYGVRAWTERADAFGVVFNLYSRIVPWYWEGGRLRRRPLLGGLPSLAIVPGTVALLVVMIGTTSFDGFSAGPIWSSLAPDLQARFIDLGLNQEHALEAAATVGLLAAVLLIGGLYGLGVAGMRSIGGPLDAKELAGRFVHSLVPISLAYVIAHYVSLLLYNGQKVVSVAPLGAGFLLTDPLGDGSHVFGTVSASIDYGVITPNGIAYAQVAALVLGHICGLVLAHDRALVLYTRARQATRSQYWMLAVMVGFTSLGLWLLSAQNQ